MPLRNGVSRRNLLAAWGGALTAAAMHQLRSASADTTTAQRPPTARIADIDENTLFDVCIIGSGFAGAILGDSLAKRGLKTVILESGPDIRNQSGDARFQQLDAYRSIGPIDYPMQSSRFRGVGGASWLWGGMSLRLHPFDFETNSYTPAGAAWPIRYKDLQAYYLKAEEALRVRGSGRSKYHPPRTAAYPVKPDRDIAPLQAILDKTGIVISDVPFSTAKNHERSFSSDRFGPFVKMTDSYLPSFQNSPHGVLIAGATVTRLNADATGAITAAEVQDLDRNRKLLRARAYVVACGGLETPRLLLLSRSASFPQGLGNHSDLVGRFFMEHRPTRFKAHIRGGWSGFSMAQLKGQSYQFYEQTKKAGFGGIVLHFDIEGAVDGQLLRRFAIGKSLSQLISRGLEIDISNEMQPSPDNRVTLNPNVKDAFGNPGANLYFHETAADVKTVNRGRELVRKVFADLGITDFKEMPRSFWAHHHMGTCRMGDDPRASVVDKHLRVHGASNLFVSGSSVFVTSGVANPTLTLTALTLRLADYLPAALQT